MGGKAQGRPGARERSRAIAELYEREAGTIKRVVASRARVPEAVLEDACQSAWERLWRHPEVSLQRDAAMRWLVVTAVRQAWRQARNESLAASPSGELPEPTRESENPLEVALAREQARVVVARLRCLSAREREFVVLHAAGLSYREIGQRTGSSVRTVERQILRGRRKLRERSDGEA